MEPITGIGKGLVSGWPRGSEGIATLGARGGEGRAVLVLAACGGCLLLRPRTPVSYVVAAHRITSTTSTRNAASFCPVRPGMLDVCAMCHAGCRRLSQRTDGEFERKMDAELKAQAKRLALKAWEVCIVAHKGACTAARAAAAAAAALSRT